MVHVSYASCPDCGASFATTHFTGCQHTGIDPRDIASPLSAKCKGFFDEHLFAWLKHMRRTYPIDGQRGYPGQPMSARTFHKTPFDDSTAIILAYDA